MKRIVNWLGSSLNWLEVRSRWSELRALGQSPLVRASVLMPAFGYILLLNEDVQHYLTTKLAASRHLPAWLVWLLPHLPSWLHDLYSWLLNHLPDLWRVWLLYYGSFCLAIGSIIFSALCPVQIKRYESPFTAANAEGKHLYYQGGMPIARDELRVRQEGLSRWERIILPEIRLDTMEEQSAIIIGRWNLENIKHPWTRIFAFLVFWSGLILLAVPAAVTFLQVTFFH